MYVNNCIGTPLSPSATRVLLLGSGELGKEVAIAFQRLGVEVHAVDRYEHAPAHQVAHAHYVMDLTDGDALYSLVSRVQPDFIVPEYEAVDSPALVRIEDEGLSTVVPSTRATRMTYTREAIRTLAIQELGVPTCTCEFASTRQEFDEAVRRIGYPSVVKPNTGTAARAHRVVRSGEDVDAAWQSAHAIGDGCVVVEQFLDFDYEVTLLVVRSVDPATGDDATWFCEPIGHSAVEGKDFHDSWQPAVMSPSAQDAARSIAARVVHALSGRGVFGVELFVKGEDVYFSEIAPRPHDTGMVTMATQRFSEFELHARAVLGLPIDVTCTSPGAAVVINAEADGSAVGYRGVADALAMPEVDLRLFGKPDCYPGRRLGVALATADTVDEARGRASLAAEKVQVIVNETKKL